MPADLTPFPESLCHRCRWLRRVGSKRGSVFLQCTEPHLPKYLPQPVASCTRFSEADASSARPDDDDDIDTDGAAAAPTAPVPDSDAEPEPE